MKKVRTKKLPYDPKQWKEIRVSISCNQEKFIGGNV